MHHSRGICEYYFSHFIEPSYLYRACRNFFSLLAIRWAIHTKSTCMSPMHALAKLLRFVHHKKWLIRCNSKCFGEKKRKPFSTKTKKIEWAIAAGRSPYASSGKLDFVKTSKCRVCKRPLTWGDRTYDFDHKDNNPANNGQTNCYLVCKVCHGKHTVIKKRKVKGILGGTVGYKTIKKKVGYKKPKKTPKKTKRKKKSG